MTNPKLTTGSIWRLYPRSGAASEHACGSLEVLGLWRVEVEDLPAHGATSRISVSWHVPRTVMPWAVATLVIALSTSRRCSWPKESP